MLFALIRECKKIAREKWRSSLQIRSVRARMCVSCDRYQGFWQFGSRAPLLLSLSLPQSLPLPLPRSALPFSSWTVLRSLFCVCSLLQFLQIAARDQQARVRSKVRKKIHKSLCRRAGLLRCRRRRRRTFRAALLTYFFANLALVTILL